MSRRLFALFCLALALPSASAARPDHASGTLYTRVSDGVVKAAVAIRIHPDRHLYHTDIGGDLDAYGDRYPGKPLRLVPRGAGIEWSSPRVPAPERFVDEKLGNWANVHSGTLTVYLYGRLEEASEVSDLRVELDGLTCSTIDRSCIRLRQVLETSGEGPEEIFTAFPKDWPAED